jgi:hypothetical protein
MLLNNEINQQSAISMHLAFALSFTSFKFNVASRRLVVECWHFFQRELTLCLFFFRFVHCAVLSIFTREWVAKGWFFNGQFQFFW